MKKLLIIPILLAAVAVGCIVGQTKTGKTVSCYKQNREMMGTYVSMIVYAPSEQKAAEAGDAAFAAADDLAGKMTSYAVTSEITNINRNAYDKEVTISDQLFKVMDLSKQFGKLTDGAFDISVTPYMELWKSAARSGIVPTDEAIKAISPSVGYDNIKLDPEKKGVRFLQPSMKIDVGGIAKGYIVDQMLATLQKHGIQAALVNAGGDIATMGTPPSGTWRIGIQKPSLHAGISISGWDQVSQEQRLPEVLHFTTGAVATSGDYERYVTIGDKQYSHIVDPRTGRPVEKMSSVTVIAPDATTADALATACSVLGPVDGLNLVAKFKNTEVMYFIQGDDGPQVFKSHGFDNYIE